MPSALKLLQTHTENLRACERCPDMLRPVVTGVPVLSPVLLLGQAPGTHEGRLGKPFAWTAGKTMFGWFERIGLGEESFRERVYMAAVCRCFPGKNPRGGDRVPSRVEVERCSSWFAREVELVAPQLILPVGKLAIAQLMKVGKLVDVVGEVHSTEVHGHRTDVIPLPHPSGASTWHRTEPGKSLLDRALGLIEQHPAWREVTASRRKARASDPSRRSASEGLPPLS